ncbi:PAS domain-containing protein [Niveispirillum sp. KHB5.9]|uniref:PAS domain-containing protein n=1 Tax=Niveispirillum sp. KHB5.9 TaxID=3400269 RepID=UPI003A8371BE
MSFSRKQDVDAVFAAMGKALCVIEFTPDGLVLDANDNFLRAVDYEQVEIKDRHHSMFMNDAIWTGADYASFWHMLLLGERMEARRSPYLAKDGRMVWFHGSYTPVFDRHGRVCKVVKVAADVTAEHLRDLEAEILTGGIDPSRLGAPVPIIPVMAAAAGITMVA